MKPRPSNSSRVTEPDQNLKARALKIFNARLETGDLDFDALINQRFKSAKNKEKLFKLAQRLPPGPKVSAVLYILTCLANEAGSKPGPSSEEPQLQRIIPESEPALVLKFSNYDEGRLVRDFCRVLFEEDLSHLFYLQPGQAGRLALPPGLVAGHQVVRLLENTNLLIFFRSRLKEFCSKPDDWPCLAAVKVLVREQIDLAGLAAHRRTLSVMNLELLVSQRFELFKTLALLVWDLNQCPSDDAALNFLLKSFYLGCSLQFRELVGQALRRVNSGFLARLAGFLDSSRPPVYYRVSGGPKTSIFPAIEVAEESLPFKIIDRDLLLKLYQVRELRAILARLPDFDLAVLGSLDTTGLSLVDENSAFVFQQRTAAYHKSIQESFIAHLLSREAIFEHLEVFRDIILGANATFMDTLLAELAQLAGAPVNRVSLLVALEGALLALGARYRPFVYQFDLRPFEPLPGEGLSQNLFLYFHFNELCGIVIDKSFQDNAMRFFNFNLRLREFVARMKGFFWPRRSALNGRMRLLYFLLEKFYQDFMFYVYHHVVEESFRALLADIRQARDIGSLYATLKRFSARLIDSCFLSHDSYGQRKVLMLVEMLGGRLEALFGQEEVTEADCTDAIRGFQKVFKGIVAALVQLEERRPEGDYAKLKVMFEFNDYFKYN